MGTTHCFFTDDKEIHIKTKRDWQNCPHRTTDIRRPMENPWVAADSRCWPKERKPPIMTKLTDCAFCVFCQLCHIIFPQIPVYLSRNATLMVKVQDNGNEYEHNLQGGTPLNHLPRPEQEVQEKERQPQQPRLVLMNISTPRIRSPKIRNITEYKAVG